MTLNIDWVSFYRYSYRQQELGYKPYVTDRKDKLYHTSLYNFRVRSFIL